MRGKNIIILSVVLLFAIALMFRIMGISWGLPNDWHFFSYHPDEATIALCTLLLDIFSLRMNPHHFNYGSLFIYLVYFATLFAIGVGLLIPQSLLTVLYWRGIHIVGRALNAFIGALNVAVVWQAARIAYGEFSAVLSALFIALSPIHVQHSHFMSVDVSLAFWSMLSLHCALRSLAANAGDGRQPVKFLLLSALFGGFAVGTKYGVLVPLCAVWALTARYIVSARLSFDGSLSSLKAAAKLFVMAFGVCIVGFLLVCPYSILAWREFIGGVSYEVNHMRTGHGELFLNTGNGHIYHLMVNLNSGMGFPLMLASIFGVVWAFVRRRPQDLILLTFVLTYYGIVGCFKVRFARYLMPIIPPLCILAGNAFSEILLPSIRMRYGRTMQTFKTLIMAAICIFVIAYTACYSIAIVKVMMLPDTRDDAAKWVRANIPYGSTVAVAGSPWFYTVPIMPIMVGPYARYFAKCPFPSSSEVREVRYKLRPTWFDLTALKRVRATVFIATEFEYREFVRLRDKRVLRTLAELERMSKKGIVFERRFERPFEFMGVRFGPKYIPHDMMYTNPTIRVFVLGKAFGVAQGQSDQ